VLVWGFDAHPYASQRALLPPQTMQCMHTLRGHSKPVTQLRLAGGRLYTAAGGAIRIWDTASLRMVGRIQTSLYSGGIRSLLVGGRAAGRGEGAAQVQASAAILNAHLQAGVPTGTAAEGGLSPG
jgi:WD40 repeat protein